MILRPDGTPVAIPTRDDVVAEKCRRSFRYFVQKAWPNTPRLAATPLVWNWHLDCLADHMQAWAKGDIRYILFNQPPRSTKTELAAIFLPAWIWTWRPSWKAMFSSKIATLSTEASVFCRQLLEESPWYQEMFVRGAWELRDDKNSKTDFANTQGGSRFATSLDGTAIGRGADGIIGDDLQDDKSAQSETLCKQVIEYWDGTLSSRANDAATVAKMYVSQRLSRMDLSNHLINSGRYLHVCLPTEYNPRRSCVTNVAGREFFRDPRTQEGELLNPRCRPLDVERQVVDDAKTPGTGMGPRKFEAQHNQNPSSETGGKYLRSYWRFYKPDGYAPSSTYKRPDGCVSVEDFPAIPLPAKLHKSLSVDTAVKPGRENDWTVVDTFGRYNALVFLLAHRRRKADIVGAIGMVKDALHEETDRTTGKCEIREKLVEDKANGSPLIQLLHSEIAGLIPIKPVDSKEERAEAGVLPRLMAGQVYLPEGAPWLEEYVDESANFPDGDHDDCVDTLSQYCNHVGPTKSSGLERARAMGAL